MPFVSKQRRAASVPVFWSVMFLYAARPHKGISVAHFPASYSMTHVNNLEYVTSVFVQRMSDEVKNSRKGRKGMAGKNNLTSYFRLGYPCAFQDAALASQRTPRCVEDPRLHLMLAKTCNVAAIW